VKVEYSKTVEIEGEVHVTVEDIRAALRESLSVATGEPGVPLSRREICKFASHVYECLSAVTDEMIAAVQPTNRTVIADALEKEAARWRQ
jgi:hypothetical protein